jgi:hypothetical protein
MNSLREIAQRAAGSGGLADEKENLRALFRVRLVALGRRPPKVGGLPRDNQRGRRSSGSMDRRRSLTVRGSLRFAEQRGDFLMETRTEERTSRFEIVELEERITPTGGLGLGLCVSISASVDFDCDKSCHSSCHPCNSGCK